MLYFLSLRTKILGYVLGLLVCVGITAIFLVNTALHDRLEQELHKRGISIAKHFAEVSANPLIIESPLSVELLAEDSLNNEEDLEYIFLESKEGAVVAHTFGKTFPSDLINANKLQPGQDYHIQKLKTEKGVIYDIVAPIMQGELGTVHVGMSQAGLAKSLDKVIGMSTRFIVGILFISAMLAIFFSRTLTEPINKLIDGTRIVGKGDLSHRIDISTHDEIGQLAASFNSMTESVQQSTVSREFMEKLINTMNDSLAVLSPSNEIILVNTAFCRMLGYNEEDLIGKPAQLFWDGGEHAFNLIMSETSRGFGNTEETYISRAGIRIPVLSSVAVMRNADGIPQGIICAAQDVSIMKQAEQALMEKQLELEELNRNQELLINQRTRQLAETNTELLAEIAERTRTEKELIVAKNEADKANHAKSEFLANMSHEIRTPLNAIIGMTDLLAGSDLGNEQKSYLDIVHRSGLNLLTLINDILDLSKVEAGLMEIEPLNFDLEELLANTCEMLAIRAHEKDLEMSYRLDPGVPSHLVGDANRLRQVIVNLLGNAIKFTDQGEVFLQVTNDYHEDGTLSLLFSITDTGIGIPKDKIHSIFGSFSQADSSITRKYGGTGLGLAIAKRLVELMGGTIRVESTEGEGSTFSFSFPCMVQQAGRSRREFTTVNFAGLKTLVVDDNRNNRFLVSEIVGRAGAHVSQADNGISALAELKRAAAEGAPYRLLLLDQYMPGMDGLQLAKLLHDEHLLGEPNTLAIMMLTSDKRSKSIARLQELGIGSYLIKPIQRKELLDAIVSLLNQTSYSQSSVVGKVADLSTGPGPQPDTDKTKRILLVEDAEDNRMLIKAYLRNTEYTLDEAENGLMALDMVKTERYDIVLMDINMPYMDGYTATREIRNMAGAASSPEVPIVALTACAYPADIQKSLAAGCTCHVSKPLKKGALLECLNRITREAGNEQYLQ